MLTYLKLAAEVADISSDTYRKAFVGAVAIRRDGVIVSSRNSSIKGSNHYPLAHAEVRVLRKAGRGATLYVARIKRDGSLAMAKPCRTCQPYLHAKGVEAVYYTISNDEWEGLRL